MTINPITNQAEMNGQEVHTLRRLDETVEREGAAIIGTQYGDVLVEAAASGYIASIEIEKYFPVVVRYGTASGAFLKLADKLRRAN